MGGRRVNLLQSFRCRNLVKASEKCDCDVFGFLLFVVKFSQAFYIVSS